MTAQGNDFKSLDKSVRIQKIIETATDVFHKKGYRSATLDDVANELGLTKAALYHYFSSKEAFLSTIYMRAIENALENARQISQLDLAPAQKLREFIRSHIKSVIIENLAAFAVFFSEENQLPEDEFQKIRAGKKKYNRVVEGILRDGMAEGCFRQVDPRFQANAILGMCNSLYRWYKPDRGHPQPGEVADLFTSFLEQGYLKTQTPADRPETPDQETKKACKEKLLKEQKRHNQVLLSMIEEL